MDYVSLQEGATLTGKSEMTIRRLTKKPGSKPNVKVEDGKIYIDRSWLLKHYPAINQPNTAYTPDPKPTEAAYTPGPEPTQAAYTPPTQPDYTELIRELKADKEYLQKQLEVERAQYHERQRESNIIIQTMQKQLPASTTADQQLINQKSNTWLKSITIGLAIMLIAVTSWLIYVTSIPEKDNPTTTQDPFSDYSEDPLDLYSDSLSIEKDSVSN